MPRYDLWTKEQLIDDLDRANARITVLQKELEAAQLYIDYKDACGSDDGIHLNMMVGILHTAESIAKAPQVPEPFDWKKFLIETLDLAHGQWQKNLQFREKAWSEYEDKLESL